MFPEDSVRCIAAHMTIFCLKGKQTRSMRTQRLTRQRRVCNLNTSLNGTAWGRARGEEGGDREPGPCWRKAKGAGKCRNRLVQNQLLSDGQEGWPGKMWQRSRLMRVVDLKGLEPLPSSMPLKRSPN